MRQFIKKCGGPAILFPLFALGALGTLLPLRVWQELERMDPKSGFWGQWSPVKETWDILQFSQSRSILALYIGLAGLIIVPALAGFALRGRCVLDLGRRPRKAESIASLLLGASMVVDAVAAFQFAAGVYIKLQQGEVLSGMEIAAYNPVFRDYMQYYVRTGTVAAVFETLAGAAGAIFFLQLALRDWFPKRAKEPGKLLALMPLAWVMCRVLRRFSRTISFVRVPDLLLDLLLLICLAIFFLAFAQLLSGINGEGKESRLLGAGMPAAILALLCFVPRAALRLRNEPPGVFPEDALIEWCDLAIALFLAIFLGGRLFVAKPEAGAGASLEAVDAPGDGVAEGVLAKVMADDDGKDDEGVAGE